jgi:hypothetical protein
MPKRDLEQLIKNVGEMAARLTEGDDKLSTAQLAGELRQSGINTDELRAKLYAAMKQLAQKERASGRPAPLALQQAMEQMSPDDMMPSSETAALSKMGRLLETFSGSFSLPEQLETARAYRKSGEISPEESADLDVLERILKEKIKKEHDGES